MGPFFLPRICSESGIGSGDAQPSARIPPVLRPCIPVCDTRYRSALLDGRPATMIPLSGMNSPDDATALLDT